MKLLNEVKAGSEPSGVSAWRMRPPVQHGDLLFELEPHNGRPLDAL